jgi:hypothetical protein
MLEIRTWLKKQFNEEGSIDVDEVMKNQDVHYEKYGKYFIPSRMRKYYDKKFPVPPNN